MAKISTAREQLLTAKERAEPSSTANARIPRSWRIRLQRSNRTITDLILKAIAEELRRIDRRAG